MTYEQLSYIDWAHRHGEEKDMNPSEAAAASAKAWMAEIVRSEGLCGSCHAIYDGPPGIYNARPFLSYITYKSADIIEGLRRAGFDVDVL